MMDYWIDMKKFLIILALSLVAYNGFAQEEEQGTNERIRDRMSEFIQKRLHVSSEESQRFTPVFFRYFKEWRTTLRDNRGDRLLLQQKVVDIRLRYRNEFREILGEKRGSQVYDHQEVFIKEMRRIGKERMESRPPVNPNKTTPPNQWKIKDKSGFPAKSPTLGHFYLLTFIFYLF